VDFCEVIMRVGGGFLDQLSIINLFKNKYGSSFVTHTRQLRSDLIRLRKLGVYFAS
jgi:hypothetical protein